MIVLSATVWPHGDQTGSYEILNVTVTNQSPTGAALDNYFAHVLSRPQPFKGLKGYEADVEVTDHKFADGFTPLLMSILGTAHATEAEPGIIFPATRQLARLELVDTHQFEELLRGRQ